MFDSLFHLAYLGPGGPEFLIVMLVLLVMFGAKDAPRILRKLNEIISQIRNTAEGFKREVMYGDLDKESSFDGSPDTTDELFHDADYDYDAEEDYYAANDYDGGDEASEVVAEEEESADEAPPVAEEVAEEEEGGDAPKA